MKNYIVSACLLFILMNNCACNKNNNEPDSNGTLLSEVRYTSETDGKTTSITSVYSYNANNKLVSLIGGIDSTFFEYNSQGQLAKVRSSNTVVGPIHVATFVYDTQGRIIKKVDTPLLANLAADNRSYSYDINNNLIADSIPNLIIPGIAQYHLYEYNSEGNLSKEYLYRNENGAAVLDTTWEHTYSNKLNPYYLNREALYFGTGSPGNVTLSKSFLTINSGPNIPEYSYYSNGLPRQIKYITTYINSPSISYGTDDFIYKK